MATRRAALLLAVLLPSACTTFRATVPLNAAAPPRTTYHMVRVGTRERRFLLHVPPAADTQRVPLVLFFHGHRGNAAIAQHSARMTRVADSLGVAVAYLDGSGRVPGVGLSWNVGNCCGWAQAHQVDELGFVDSVRAALGRSGRIDTTAVFAAGFSAGGMLALELACDRSEAFVAVADLAGAMPVAPCRPRRPLGVLFVHGDDDDDLREDHAEQAQVRGAPPYATSTGAAVRFWERNSRCTGQAVTEAPAGGVVVRTRSGVACAPGAGVESVAIPKHPHAFPGGRPTWLFGQKPSQAVNGALLVLAFFKAQLAALRQATPH